MLGIPFRRCSFSHTIHHNLQMELRKAMNLSGTQKKVTGLSVAKASASGAGLDDN